MTSFKLVIVGAGPVGSLAAFYGAKRGWNVEIYELRADQRDKSGSAISHAKSINLSLSHRGITALREADFDQSTGEHVLLDKIIKDTVPMAGRMIHGRRPNGKLYEEVQQYDIHGRANYACDRALLNKHLLDAIEGMSNVKIFFQHKLANANFDKGKAWFEKKCDSSADDQSQTSKVEVDFDLMIGADGAHSSVRSHMMKATRLNYQQEYIDALWCQFEIPPVTNVDNNDPDAKFRISPNNLHIWPGKEFMFIAIPSPDGTFVCTLFAPATTFSNLEANPKDIPSFFDHYFPGVTDLIPPTTLRESFTTNAHLPLITIKCSPHVYSSSVAIVGDAAHAMVPFYGQGMNSGLEDVRVLFGFLDGDATQLGLDGGGGGSVVRKEALRKYDDQRVADAHAINDLALANYEEMRASVLNPVYRLRKFLEEALDMWVPGLGWRTKYSRVSFSDERYSEVVRRSEWQGRMLLRGFVGLVGLPVVTGAVWAAVRYRRSLGRLFNGILGQVHGMFV